MVIVFPTWRAAAVLAAAGALTTAGCAFIEPYEAPEPAPVHLRREYMQLAGDAEAQLMKADDLRNRYLHDLGTSSVIGSGVAVAATAISGWAVYNALKPLEAGATSAAIGDRQRGLRLGVVLGGLYGLKTLFESPERDSIYAEGYRALSCLILQSGPLLMTESSLPLVRNTAAVASGVATSASDAASSEVGQAASQAASGAVAVAELFAPEQYGDLDRLHASLKHLSAEILQLNLNVPN